MVNCLFLIFSWVLTCGFALSNVSLIDEKSGVSLSMIGPTKPGEEGALSLELTIKNKHENYYIIVTGENEQTICHKEFTASDSEHLKCSYDKSILKHGDNNFVITIYSTDQDKIVLRTVGHFFYQGYSLNGVDVTDTVTAIIENRDKLLAAAGLTAVVGIGRSIFNNVNNVRGGGGDGAKTTVSSLPTAVLKPPVASVGAYRRPDVPTVNVVTSGPSVDFTSLTTTSSTMQQSTKPVSNPLEATIAAADSPPVVPSTTQLQSVLEPTEVINSSGEVDKMNRRKDSKKQHDQNDVEPPLQDSKTSAASPFKNSNLGVLPIHRVTSPFSKLCQAAKKLNSRSTLRTTGIILGVLFGTRQISSAVRTISSSRRISSVDDDQRIRTDGTSSTTDGSSSQEGLSIPNAVSKGSVRHNRNSGMSSTTTQQTARDTIPASSAAATGIGIGIEQKIMSNHAPHDTRSVKITLVPHESSSSTPSTAIAVKTTHLPQILQKISRYVAKQNEYNDMIERDKRILVGKESVIKAVKRMRELIKRRRLLHRQHIRR